MSLFPQLIAGPIVRYQTVEKELDDRVHSFKNFAYGIRRFSIGLAKKVLIANALGELCTKAFALNETTVIFYWIFGISYMLQLYGTSLLVHGSKIMFIFHLEAIEMVNINK